jgi:hypothetical protein
VSGNEDMSTPFLNFIDILAHLEDERHVYRRDTQHQYSMAVSAIAMNLPNITEQWKETESLKISETRYLVVFTLCTFLW